MSERFMTISQPDPLEAMGASLANADSVADEKSVEITRGEAFYWMHASEALNAHIKYLKTEYSALKKIHQGQDKKIRELTHNLGVAKSTSSTMTLFGIFAGALTAGMPLFDRFVPTAGLAGFISLETAGYIGGFCTAALIPATSLYVYWRHKHRGGE